MDLCDALREYGTWADYAALGIFYILGFWKLIELGKSIERWAIRRIQ